MTELKVRHSPVALRFKYDHPHHFAHRNLTMSYISFALENVFLPTLLQISEKFAYLTQSVIWSK